MAPEIRLRYLNTVLPLSSVSATGIGVIDLSQLVLQNVAAERGVGDEARLEGEDADLPIMADRCHERIGPDIGADVVEHVARLDHALEPMHGPRLAHHRARARAVLPRRGDQDRDRISRIVERRAARHQARRVDLLMRAMLNSPKRNTRVSKLSRASAPLRGSEAIAASGARTSAASMRDQESRAGSGLISATDATASTANGMTGLSSPARPDEASR